MRTETYNAEYVRSRVPGGWHIRMIDKFSHIVIFQYFYLDPAHSWDGQVSGNDELEAGFLHD